MDYLCCVIIGLFIGPFAKRFAMRMIDQWDRRQEFKEIERRHLSEFHLYKDRGPTKWYRG